VEGGASIPMMLAVKLTKPEIGPKVRQAIAYAIDRETIREGVFKNQVEIIDGFGIGPWRNQDLDHYGYDPEKSRQLLEEAGWDPDRELYIFYYYRQDWADEVLTAIQAYLADVGIKSYTRFGDWSQDEQDWYLTDTADIELTAQALYGSPDNMLQILGCDFEYPAGWNGTHFCNPRFDELFAKAGATADFEKQKEYYDEAQQLVNEEQPYIWLFTKPAGIVFNNRVHIVSDGLYVWRYQYDKNLYEWWIEE
jgi:peptide/nickel transport system substrate-binding protein